MLFIRATEAGAASARKLIKDAATALRNVEAGGEWAGEDARLVALMLVDAATKSPVAYHDDRMGPGEDPPKASVHMS